MEGEEFYQLYPYKVPTWASSLKNIPTNYVKLSNLHTPIHRWNLPDIPDGFTIHIKRDDLTGAELSGNKVRCLQIMFAEALQAGCKHVVTGGGPDSGQCRAMSLACRSLGLVPHIISEAATRDEVGNRGNALLYRLAGSHVYLTPKGDFESFKSRVHKMCEFISEKYKEKCFPFPVGGSSVKGLFGFISLFQELLDQGLHNRFDDIVIAVATCPTSTGLAVANYLTGSKVKYKSYLLKIHSISVGLSKEELKFNIDGLLRELGLNDVTTEDIVDVIDGYVGERYGTVTEEVLDFITKVSSTTGVLLDPYYTAKGAFGMLKELQQNPGRFQGKRILFVHTGGIFGLFNGELDRVIDREESVTADFLSWPDADIPPWQ